MLGQHQSCTAHAGGLGHGFKKSSPAHHGRNLWPVLGQKCWAGTDHIIFSAVALLPRDYLTTLTNFTNASKFLFFHRDY